MTTATTTADSELAAALERHRREILVLCYRMTGSFADAEDLTQETFLRAWRSRHGFRRESSLRTWLYRIATNACLDFLARHERRASPAQSLVEVLDSEGAISPFPDRQLTTGPGSPDPAVAVETKETTELLLVAALLQLPPRQRIALIAREFLELTAAQTAALLDVSVPSANSLVQRARAEIRRRSATPAPVADADEEELVRRYVRAHVDGDVHAIAAMLADDVRISMPPERPLVGREAATSFFTAVVGSAGPGEWWLVPVRANGRPATANYLRMPGAGTFRATSLDVLEIRAGQLAVVNCFLSGRHFPAFGLPEVLDEAPRERSETVLPRLDLNQ